MEHKDLHLFDPSHYERLLPPSINQEIIMVRNGLVVSILNKDPKHRITIEQATKWLDEVDIPQGLIPRVSDPE